MKKLSFLLSAAVAVVSASAVAGEVYRGLPRGYKQVEYLDSPDGNCVINTGIKAKKSISAEMDYMPRGYTGNVVLGMNPGNDNADWRYFCYSKTSEYFDYGNVRISSTAGVELEKRYVVSCGCGFAKCVRVEDQAVIYDKTGSTTGGEPLEVSIGVFGGPSNPMETLFNWVKMRLYALKLWDGEDLVADLVPAIRESDNEYGLYDMERGVFLANVLAGKFTVGNEVLCPVDAVLVREGGDWKTQITINEGTYDLTAVLTDESGVPEERPIVTGASASGSPYLYTITGLEKGDSRKVEIVAESPEATKTFPVGTIYNGALTIERVCDADEASGTAGEFLVRLADGGAAAEGLTVEYAVNASSTAVPGASYVALPGYVNVPAGQDEVTIRIEPLLNPAVKENTTVTLDLGDGIYDIGDPATATLTIVSSGRGDRKIPISNTMILDCEKSSAVMVAFDGVFLGQNTDPSTWAYVDLGAKYHLTRIFYTGRQDNKGNCDIRLRNARFVVSDDGETWRTIYTVPGSFVQLDGVTNQLSVANQQLTARYVGWENVAYGSISEIEWRTDSDVLVFATPSFGDVDATGATMNFKVSESGSFPAGENIRVTAYKSPVDLGDDLADWQDAEGVLTEDFGEVVSGETIAKRITAVPDSETTVVRLLATCGGKSFFMLDPAAFDVDLDPTTYVAWRPLVDSSWCVPTWITACFNRDWAFFAFDGKDDTAAHCEYQAADFGRPIRVDKVRMVTTGSAGHPVQGSNDGWNYETIVARETSDPLTVEYKFAEPKVYRYFRIFYEKEPQTPAINEVTFYTKENAPYVAVDDETEIARTTSGIRLAGKVFAGGDPAPEQIALRAWVADRDYGTDEAAWTAAGVEPVELGAFAAGADYSVGPIAGEAGKVNFVRLQAVCAVDGAANGFGERHAFTMTNEKRIPMDAAGVKAVMVDTWANIAEAAVPNVVDHEFAMAGTLNWNGDYNPWGGSFAKRYRITRIEWMPRMQKDCIGRSRSAVYYISDDEAVVAKTAITSCTRIGSGNGNAGYGDGWNQIYVGGKKARHFYQSGDGNGNEFVRIWGEVDSGLMMIIK